MTMEPTMQLRWVYRGTLKQHYNNERITPDGYVLQQLWIKPGSPLSAVFKSADGEWRDIPEVREA